MQSLLITNDFPPIVGGQSSYLYNLWAGLPQDKIIVLAPKVSGWREFDKKQNFEIVRRRYLFPLPLLERPIKIILSLIFAYSLIRKRAVYNIHCGQVLSAGLVGLILGKIFNKPYILYTFASDILEFKKCWLINKARKVILNNAYKIVSISKFTRSKLLEEGVAFENTIVIYPAFDVGKFTREAGGEEIIKKYDLEGKKIILSVNRLVKRKGNDSVIQTLPHIKKEIPNVVYLVVGDGPYFDTLNELVKKYGVEKNLIFAGSCLHDAVGKFYSICDIFIMPSRELKEKGDVEGFGIAFLEANAWGKPVIGGRSGGIEEAVVDGETGLLVNPHNLEEIHRSIAMLLKNPDYAQALGEKGRKRVIRDFAPGASPHPLRELIAI